MNKEALNNILCRKSIRTYSNKRISQDTIQIILEAAMAAPSAINTQPWDFIVVTEKERLMKVASVLPYARMAASCQAVFVVCGNMNKAIQGEHNSFWIQDCSAASENLLLACHALELGAVWTGVYPAEERVEAVKNVLNLPDFIIPLNVICVGYPVNEINKKNKTRYKKENVHMERWK